MISNIKAKLDAARTILYETARFVDVYKIWEQISRERSLTPEERAEMKRYNRLADAFTPLSKASSSEYANQTAYDCIQIHGGSGFMRDYTCERLYRDARIMNIYEGTTQLQVVAAIRHVTTGTYLAQMKEYAAGEYSDQVAPLKARVDKMMEAYEQAVEKVKSFDDPDYITFHARRLVEMAAWTIMSYLLCYDASHESSLLPTSPPRRPQSTTKSKNSEKIIYNANREPHTVATPDFIMWRDMSNISLSSVSVVCRQQDIALHQGLISVRELSYCLYTCL